MRRTLLIAAGALLYASQMPAQGYRVRLDSRIQAVSWRGLDLDSVPIATVTHQANGGIVTSDGFAATCGNDWCHFFRAGPQRRGVPWVTQASASIWGLGITGLRLFGDVRYATDIGTSARWPGSEPALQLVEAYAEYVRDALAVHAGRQFLATRLGAYGFDGARVTWRGAGRFDAAAYGGWGFARGSVLPVTSPALNPLDDFQPRDRQVVAGAEVGWSSRIADARAEYRREVDPAVDYFVSERVAGSVALKPLPRVSVTAGGTYDLAFEQWGSADAMATYAAPRGSITVGARRYLPFFDLWTIWGAFSPVAFHAWHGSATLMPISKVVVRGRAERYVFDDAETSTGLVSGEDRGWRISAAVSWTPSDAWSIDVGHDAEFGPGAASHGFDARLTWNTGGPVVLGAHAATMQRPLEFRFSDATLAMFGVDAEWRSAGPWRVGVSATRIDERRERPDAASMNWDQFRLSARVSWTHGSDPQLPALPRAARTGGTP